MIIADTSAIVASIDSDATEHEDCARLVTETDSTLLVSHMVVAEVDYLLTARFGIATANRFLSDVATDAYLLASTDQSDLQDAISLNARYADHRLGVTDCLNVVLAERHATTKIFTLDERHFRVVRPVGSAGAFELLPADQR